MNPNCIFVLVFLIIFTLSVTARVPQHGPAILSLNLDSFILNYKQSSYFCRHPEIRQDKTGYCDLEITMLFCNVLSNSKSPAEALQRKYMKLYSDRYNNYAYVRLTKAFRSKLNVTPECAAPLRPIRLQEVMDETFSKGLISIDLPTKNFHQIVHVWLGVINDNRYNFRPDHSVWFADFWMNTMPIMSKARQKTDPDLILLEKTTFKYGYMDGYYGFFPMTSHFTLSVSYRCDEYYYGPYCSIYCKPSDSHECIPETGNKICKPGRLPIVEKTHMKFGPSVLTNCNFNDSCYENNCSNDTSCIRISNEDYECVNITMYVSPMDRCVKVDHVAKCMWKTENFYNDTISYTSKWTYNEINEGVLISDDKITFSKAVGRTEKYGCEVTVTIINPSQTFTEYFDFIVYDVQYQMLTSIQNEVMVYGEEIQCYVEDWDTRDMEFQIKPKDPKKMFFRKTDYDTFRLLANTSLENHTFTCYGTFKDICPLEVNFTGTSWAFVIPYRYFDWCWRELNLFYIHEHKWPLCCETEVGNEAVVNVRVLIGPSFKVMSMKPVNFGKPNRKHDGHSTPIILDPGYYYVACQLSFLNSSFRQTIYKSLYIYHYPSVDDLSIDSGTLNMDSKISCEPLPYPKDDFEYSITFYDGQGVFMGIVYDYEVDPIPDIFETNKIYIIECSYIRKGISKRQKRSIIVPKAAGNEKISDHICINKKLKFQGWARPISLKYWNRRAWAKVVFATVIIIAVMLVISWLIHIRSTASLSGLYLTRRTLMFTNLKRRNTNFFRRFIDWLESINSILITVGTLPLSSTEGYALMKKNPDVMLDFYQFLNGQDSHANDLASLKEKSKILQMRVTELRRHV